MKNIQFTLYRIDELKTIDLKAYNRAIDNAKQSIIDIRFDDASFDSMDILKNRYNLKIDQKNIFYSISFCQGDGFCFIDSNILSYSRLTKKENMNAFEKWITDNLTDHEKTLLLDYLNCNYNLNILKKSHHYNHAYTCIIDYEYFYSSDDQNYLDDMNDFISKLADKLFNSVYIPICKDLEKELYKNYDVDDSDAIDFCNCNDYYFYDDGDIYY